MKPTASATVINEVFRRAYERGERPALVDLRGGHVHGYRRLVTEVTRAASGLVRAGARRGQVVGVHVSTAGAQTLAVHTVLAAGGVAAPLDPELDTGRLAARLRECGARALITTPDLAATAARAAEAARVRQLVSFGAAPGALDFRALLTLEPTALPPVHARHQTALLLAGGAPPARRLSHAELLATMAELDRPVRLRESDVVLITRRPGGDADLVALIGLILWRGALVVASGGLELPDTRRDFGVTVAEAPGGGLERVG
ncbi:AMP-binding protein [Nonomuraea sp. NPDC050783]|uniref:AMP-binding protein n=1 Tax=Nonomuraea sp. NPDC050783 TaxID=3154634 RepID=UPI0034672C6D